MSTSNLCIFSCIKSSKNPSLLAYSSFSDSAFSCSLSFSRSFDFASLRFTQTRSRICARNEGLEASSTGIVGADDLLIIGPGVLGRIVAEKWHQEHPGSLIYAQTLTSDHHDELAKMGINPSLKRTQVTRKFSYVIFCAPPSRSPDYPGEVRDATLNWNGKGSFLFTSSSAPYDCSDNGYCDEGSPVVPLGRSPKTDNLLKTEKVVLEAGGCIVRLAGLYKVDRGAHSYWLKKGIVDVRPDHILNLIHYEMP